MSATGQQSEEQRNTARLLRVAQQRFGNFLSSLPVGIAIVGSDCAIESVNPVMVCLFGYSERELIGQDLRLVVANAPWKTGLEFVQWCSDNRDSTVELEGRNKDGERVPIDLSVRHLDEDSCERSVAVIQDVTQRYLANKRKEEIYQMINHDVRSPISAIEFCLAMMECSDRYGTLTEEGRESVSLARYNAQRVITLVSGLLELDRLEAGKDYLKKEPVSVQRLVAESVASVKEIADAKAIGINTHVTDALVEGDLARLVQVVVNLLSNAIEHSASGQLLELTATSQPDCVRVSVRDHGPGIPDAVKAAIFERFQQGSTEKGEGFGLGLAICKEIVRQHGGKIGCDDAPGGGTIFWFQIPAKAQADSRCSSV